ncbi:MAG: hypothetical protein ABI745_04745 [Caldimonas sp.]
MLELSPDARHVADRFAEVARGGPALIDRAPGDRTSCLGAS